jgi:hypothetical protein
MIIGSLSGPLCAAGGFCAGNEEVVEHQRISSASYTYSAALPALLSTTASETISLLQQQPDILAGLRENVKAMRGQLDPRSDWVRCSSSGDNPIMLLVLKDEVIDNKKLSIDDQNQIFREVVDEVRFLILYSGLIWDSVLTTIVSRKRRSHNTTQVFSSRSWTKPPRRWLATYPCTQSVCDQRSDEEGDREGWHYHKTRHHQDREQAKVDYKRLEHWSLSA